MAPKHVLPQASFTPLSELGHVQEPLAQTFHTAHLEIPVLFLKW
jgi:hypothetical protein